MLSTKRADGAGKSVTVKVVKRRAIEVYACEQHRDHFDKRKAEATAAADAERARKRDLRRKGNPAQPTLDEAA